MSLLGCERIPYSIMEGIGEKGDLGKKEEWKVRPGEKRAQHYDKITDGLQLRMVLLRIFHFVDGAKALCIH